MTKQNKLIVGGVVLVALLFLYDRNKKMKEVAMMKAQADMLAENQRETKAITKAGFNKAKGDNTVLGNLGLPTMVDN
jgi:high-affinity Fe2+/Pb2+ permease